MVGSLDVVVLQIVLERQFILLVCIRVSRIVCLLNVIVYAHTQVDECICVHAWERWRRESCEDTRSGTRVI